MHASVSCPAGHATQTVAPQTSERTATSSHRARSNQAWHCGRSDVLERGYRGAEGHSDALFLSGEHFWPARVRLAQPDRSIVLMEVCDARMARSLSSPVISRSAPLTWAEERRRPDGRHCAQPS